MMRAGSNLTGTSSSLSALYALLTSVRTEVMERKTLASPAHLFEKLGADEPIEEVSTEVSGVVACKVDVKKGRAEVEHEHTLNLNLLKQEIERLGTYKVLLPK